MDSSFFKKFKFSPIVKLPDQYEVFDFTKSYDPFRTLKHEFGVGRYNEKRAGMYTQSLFSNQRDIHMGIDIGGPVNTEVYSFFDGEIFLTGDNKNAGDYGPTIITKHQFGEKTLYALYGHLSRESLKQSFVGKKIESGEIIGWFGSKEVNGGWNPHVHFQLCTYQPSVPDLPGVVSDDDRAQALRDFPDPRLVLGPLY